MQAAIFCGAFAIGVEQIPDAVLQEPGDAVVQITHACICGTDLWPYRGQGSYQPGWQIGHERSMSNVNLDRRHFDPDHVSIAIHNYRWRFVLVEGESKYDDPEKRLAECLAISVLIITLEGNANGSTAPGCQCLFQ